MKSPKRSQLIWLATLFFWGTLLSVADVQTRSFDGDSQFHSRTIRHLKNTIIENGSPLRFSGFTPKAGGGPNFPQPLLVIYFEGNDLNVQNLKLNASLFRGIPRYLALRTLLI